MSFPKTSPITVEKISNPSDHDIAALRFKIEAEIVRVYYIHRPEWETRPLSLVRGETLDAQLDILAAQATAAAAAPPPSVPHQQTGF